MYSSSIVATALMAASVVLADSPGTAQVINGCKYDVNLANTPAANGGFDIINKVLSPGDSYSQTYTELTNLMGWSIKVAKDTDYTQNVLQFEYTYLPGDPIWYDISEVNGNPWNENWEISATGGNGCAPRQAAYRYATDDAYGMQSCDVSADITLLLCSGEDQNDGVASSVSESMVESATATPTSVAESPSATAEPTSATWAPRHKQVENVDVAPSPTTFATQTTQAPNGNVVTEYATAVVTEVVYATAYGKRDAAAHHAHVHRHVHHPHARR